MWRESTGVRHGCGRQGPGRMEAARGARGLECMEAQDGDMWDRERGFGNAVRGEG